MQVSENIKVLPQIESVQDFDIDLLANDQDLLARLADYVKYLYEEEKERRDVLNNTTKIFLGTFGFVLSVGFAKITYIEKLPSMIQNLSNRAPYGEYMALVCKFLLLTSSGLLFLAFLFTILVVKMWKRERLCDPQRFVFRAMTMPNEARLLSAMVADFAVAADRNQRINEQKAKLLSKALLSFICGFVLFAGTWILLQSLNTFWK